MKHQTDSFPELEIERSPRRWIKWFVGIYLCIVVAMLFLMFSSGIILKSSTPKIDVTVALEPENLTVQIQSDPVQEIHIRRSDLFPKVQFNSRFFKHIFFSEAFETSLPHLLKTMGILKDESGFIAQLASQLFKYTLQSSEFSCSLESLNLTDTVCAPSSIPFLSRPFIRAGIYFFSKQTYQYPNGVEVVEIERHKKSLFVVFSDNTFVFSPSLTGVTHLLARKITLPGSDPRQYVSRSFLKTSETNVAFPESTEEFLSWPASEQLAYRDNQIQALARQFSWVDGFYQMPASVDTQQKMDHPYGYGGFSVGSEGDKSQIEIAGNFFPRVDLQSSNENFVLKKHVPSQRKLELFLKFQTAKKDSIGHLSGILKNMDTSVPAEFEKTVGELSIVWNPQSLYEIKDMFKFVVGGIDEFPSRSTNFGFMMHHDGFSSEESVAYPRVVDDIFTEGISLGQKMAQRLQNQKRYSDFDPSKNILYVATNPRMLESFQKESNSVIRDEPAKVRSSEMHGNIDVLKILFAGSKTLSQSKENGAFSPGSFSLNHFVSENGFYNATISF